MTGKAVDHTGKKTGSGTGIITDVIGSTSAVDCRPWSYIAAQREQGKTAPNKESTNKISRIHLVPINHKVSVPFLESR